MNEDERRKEAIWRVMVLGPLASAWLEHGDVRRLCEEVAAWALEGPDGDFRRLSWRTI